MSSGQHQRNDGSHRRKYAPEDWRDDGEVIEKLVPHG